ncbi:MerR family transcriptional regulator [Romboutsia lituseburensis]|uniref:DNA-binding transcriptional regulator, MerR family n=1 Tax=Romboutsia lituseburensis DSM 797 TaxID=1121325 RepID=A0A1G9J344_9FIRM|nr:MerR family transcriptional regulator [Romboutsia lituseburensis]SDL31594.1 DNA-binding transcriptional regulator, MerR family [Romboutsia lituseburensis DSM 797]
MSTYFTIGEISKFFNIPIKTLRYYDEIDLLKPARINKDNKYRYYSVEQFIKIDLIKHFKATGMSLEVIKSILNSDCSIELVLENIKLQSKKLEHKINELTNVKNYLDNLEKNISQNIEYGLDEIFIKYNDERIYMNYDVVSTNLEELDINLRDVILDLEKNNKEAYSQTGATISYDILKNEKKVLYKGFKAFCNDNKNVNILPKGDYITLIFEGSLIDSVNHYKKILDFIEENNIEVQGDFNEVWIMPKIDENLKEKSLVKIEILKK